MTTVGTHPAQIKKWSRRTLLSLHDLLGRRNMRVESGTFTVTPDIDRRDNPDTGMVEGHPTGGRDVSVTLNFRLRDKAAEKRYIAWLANVMATQSWTPQP